MHVKLNTGLVNKNTFSVLNQLHQNLNYNFIYFILYVGPYTAASKQHELIVLYIST